MDSPPPGPESTLGERCLWVIKKRGYPNNQQWPVDAGMGPGTVGLYITGERGTNFRKDSAQKLGDAAGVSWTWLMDGQLPWEPYVGPKLAKRRILEESGTPHPPPASSGVRKVVGDHWATDEEENLVIEAARLPGLPPFDARHSRPAQLFVRQAKPDLKPGATRLDLMKDAIEAAYDIVEGGGDPTYDAIFAWLRAKRKITFARPGGTPLDQVLAAAEQANEEEDDIYIEPAPAPAAPAPVTPSPVAKSKKGKR